MSIDIPVAQPWLTEREYGLVEEAVREGWGAGANRYQSKFEDAFADHCGRRYAFALPSCTAGLHLALAGLGIGPGDEVIVPDITWIATSAPVSYLGATPVFADIDPQTWCLSPASLQSALTARTRAAVAVDLYGNMPDWEGLAEVADRADIVLIEDAAEAIGATYADRPAGAHGAVSAFSFHGSKTLTTGEGGMVVTDDPRLADRIGRLRDHGREPGDIMFRNNEVGFKYKMSAMQAALGLAQLERIAELVARKRDIFRWYSAALEDIDGLSLNRTADGSEGGYWMTTVLLDPDLGLTKDQVIGALADRGIASRPFFHPLSSLDAYAGTDSAAMARERNEIAYRLFPYGLNLPSGPNLAKEAVDRVAGVLRKIVCGPRSVSTRREAR